MPASSPVRRLLAAIAGAPVVLACVTLFALMVMTFADVVLRSAFDAPLAAATELTRMMMAVVVFSVLPVMSFRGGHISVDLLDGVTPAWLRRVRDVLMSAACGVLLLWPANRIVVLAERARDYGDTTEYLAVPTFYLTWFIAIATFLTAVTLIARAVALAFAPHLVESES